jgi:hypothetical protein
MAFASQLGEGPALLAERAQLGDRLSAIRHHEALPLPRPLHEFAEPGLELFDSNRVRGVSGSHLVILEVVTWKVKRLGALWGSSLVFFWRANSVVSHLYK